MAQRWAAAAEEAKTIFERKQWEIVDGSLLSVTSTTIQQQSSFWFLSNLTHSSPNFGVNQARDFKPLSQATAKRLRPIIAKFWENTSPKASPSESFITPFPSPPFWLQLLVKKSQNAQSYGFSWIVAIRLPLHDLHSTLENIQSKVESIFGIGFSC